MPAAMIGILGPIGGALGATTATMAVVVGGAVVGAAVGAVVSAVKGGSILKGALMGALAGAAVGGVSALLAPEAIAAAGAKMSAAAGPSLSTLEAAGGIDAGSAGGGLSTLEGAGGISTAGSKAPTLRAPPGTITTTPSTGAGWKEALIGGIGPAAGGVLTAFATEDEEERMKEMPAERLVGTTGQFTARPGSPISKVQGTPASQLASEMSDMQTLISGASVTAPAVQGGLLNRPAVGSVNPAIVA